MKQAVKKILARIPPLIILFFAICVLLFPGISAQGIHKGLQVCLSAVFTSLFPFFIISDLCCTRGYAEKTASSVTPLTKKLFHIGEESTAAFLLGILGGYPVGAKTALEMYRCGKISKEECERIILFCNNAGPAFVIGFVGAGIFKKVLIGVLLYAVHILSACILGVYYRPDYMKPSQKNCIHPISRSLGSSITEAIKKAGQTTIHVCTFILFFSILDAYFNAFLPQQLKPYPLINLLLSSLELAGGLNNISTLIHGSKLFCISSFLLGWGGLCVNFQTLALFDDTEISVAGYLRSKLYQGLISIILSVPICLILSRISYI